jgi:hypothetical protein
LAITLEAVPIAVGDHRSLASVDVVIYDFGAITVTHTIPFQGSLAELASLGNDVFDCDELTA